MYTINCCNYLWAGSGADSVGSRNGTEQALDSSGAQYGIMDLKGSARPPQNMTMRQIFSVADWLAIPTKSSA